MQGVRVRLLLLGTVLQTMQDWSELLWRAGLFLEAVVALLQLEHHLGRLSAMVGVGVSLGLCHPMPQVLELGLYRPRLQVLELELYRPMLQVLKVTNFVMVEPVAVLPLVVLSAEAPELIGQVSTV